MADAKIEEDEKKVKITIEKITIEFPQELRPLERIIAGITDIFDGYLGITEKKKNI